MAGVEGRELGPVVASLVASLSARLGAAPSAGLGPGLVRALAGRLGLRAGGKVEITDLLNTMKTFGLEMEHISPARLEEGDLLHQYFLLDLANVLVDSIQQVKQARTTRLLRGRVQEAAGSSGGEEVARILEEARVKYGAVRSFRAGLDRADISFIPPRQPEAEVAPQQLPRQPGNASKSITDSSEVKDTSDHFVATKAQPKPKRQKLAKEAMKTRKVKEKENCEDIAQSVVEDETDHEINVNIPISDTTDVLIKVKPLDNKELKSQRIHVRVNQKVEPERKKSKSRHIVYGSKNIVSHHLRKTRPPLFSRKLATPKLDRKQVLEKVVNEVKKERQREKEEVTTAEESKLKPDLDFKLKAQKVLREKRTKNAQFRKMMDKL